MQEFVAILGGIIGIIVSLIKTFISSDKEKAYQDKVDVYYSKVLLEVYEQCLLKGVKSKKEVVSGALKQYLQYIPTYISYKVDFNHIDDLTSEEIDEICRIMLVDYERFTPNKSNILRDNIREMMFKMLSIILFGVGALFLYESIKSLTILQDIDIDTLLNTSISMGYKIISIILLMIILLIMFGGTIFICFICLNILYKLIISLVKDDFDLYVNDKKNIEAKRKERLKAYKKIEGNLIWKIDGE